MISRVLVPMDDSARAEDALRHALEAHPDAEVTVLHVVGEPSGMMGEATSLALSEDFPEETRERAREVHERARDIASEFDVDVETEVEVGSPGRAINEYAEEFDLVVIASHGSSLADRLFVGNVTETVFRRSPIPVTIVR